MRGPLLLSLTVFCAVHAVPQLQFVTAMWRHGDRAPERTFPNDRVQESDWTEGGGGLGQLTTAGMRMHLNLGKKLRTRYIDSTPPLLSRQYSSKEIYVRATDYNRTIISAMSNLAGMYSQDVNQNRPGVDYPSTDQVAGWPGTFVPIAIHTVDNPTDYVGNPDYDCPRRDQLFNLVKTSPEYQAILNFPGVNDMLQAVGAGTGVDNLSLETLWMVVDTLFIENIYHHDTMADWYPWYPDNEHLLTVVNDDMDDFQDGLLLANPVIQGIDTSTEIKKLRGGSLIRLVNDHFKQKMDVLEGRSNNTFYTNLKYFVVSAHDTTLAAYLALLGAKQNVVRPGGYPQYSAAILNELYKDDQTGEYSVQLFYHASENATVDFDSITKYIEGCPVDGTPCPIAVFDALATKYDPGDNAQTCATDVIGTTTPSTTTVTGRTTGTTVQNGGDGSSSSSSSVGTTPSTASPTTSTGVSTFSAFFGVSLVLAALRI